MRPFKSIIGLVIASSFITSCFQQNIDSKITKLNSRNYIPTIFPSDTTKLWISDSNIEKDTILIVGEGGPKNSLDFANNGRIYWEYLDNYNNYQKGIKLGVNVYIDKSHVKNEIKYGIRALKNRSKFLCDCLTEEMSIINGFANKISTLGAKEQVFLNGLKEGKSIQDISNQMVISNKSVKQIISNICTAINIRPDNNTLTSWAKSHKHYIN